MRIRKFDIAWMIEWYNLFNKGKTLGVFILFKNGVIYKIVITVHQNFNHSNLEKYKIINCVGIVIK